MIWVEVVFLVLALMPPEGGYGEPSTTSVSETQIWHAAYSISGHPHWASEAVAVARCESTFQLDAVGNLGEQGLWQIRPEFWGSVPQDVYGQVKLARFIWEQTNDWSAWSCEP
jgi:hypothetical protein